jgi:hypothetical protein
VILQNRFPESNKSKEQTIDFGIVKKEPIVVHGGVAQLSCKIYLVQLKRPQNILTGTPLSMNLVHFASLE